MIREYDPARHRDQLRPVIVELHDVQHGLEPALPEGDGMADAYLTFLLERCARSAGKVFVAELDGVVVGFVGVLAEVRPRAPDEEQASYAYLSDLAVLPAYRGRGIGRALLEHAEAYARGAGAKSLRLGVLVKNEPARRLYREAGFIDYQLLVIKRL